MHRTLERVGGGAREWLSFTLLYLLIVPWGTVLFMVLLEIFGYLPYSDRPGPGWQGWRFSIRWDEIVFLGGFGLIMIVPAAISASALFGLSRLLKSLRMPRWAIVLVGMPSSVLVSGFLVANFGWLIAIGDVPVWGSLALGALFGVWRFAPHILEKDPAADRTLGH